MKSGKKRGEEDRGDVRKQKTGGEILQATKEARRGEEGQR